MASGADHLLRLTYRENVVDEAQARDDWFKFNAKSVLTFAANQQLIFWLSK